MPNDVNGTRECNVCHDYHPLSHEFFNRDNRPGRGGFATTCRKCNSERCKSHYRKDPEKQIARSLANKELYAQNPPGQRRKREPIPTLPVVIRTEETLD